MSYQITTFFSTTIVFLLFVFGSGPGPELAPYGPIAICGGGAGIASLNDNGKFMVPVTGVGRHTYKISTSSDSAQFYFNQGLNFYYGYHFPEAVASFKEASRFDPKSAMTYWGQAIAMGPFYNNYYYKMGAEVPNVVAQMVALSDSVTQKERDLIAAMKHRYSDDFTNADRPQLDERYVTATALLVSVYPDDDDMKALHIDAVMLAHRWDFYDKYGKEKPWTHEVVAECEAILKNNPSHPAALHYYIHVTEASRKADRALPAADLLKNEAPGIGHMVHMSTHMYQRNGLYTKGVEWNERAHEVNNSLDKRLPWMGFGQDKSTHYYAVQSFCAMTAGMDSKGLPVYTRARDRILALTPENFDKNTYSQYLYMIPTIAMVRLGKWDEILSSTRPDKNWVYASIIDHFARGMAQVRKGELKKAHEHVRGIELLLDNKLLAERAVPFNMPLQGARIARELLLGEILFKEGHWHEAMKYYSRAIREEDGLIYREPHDWMIPARQFLGARMLEANEAREAELVYKEDLAKNPGNGWSLLGMSQTLKMLKRDQDAATFEERAKQAFELADTMPTASVY